MKKHLILSTLLLLVLYNLIGFVAAFEAVRFEWRQSVRAELATVAKGNLVRLVFSKNDSRITKKEFKHKGKYYDVVRTETTGDSVNVYCFDDETETRLTAEFHDLIIENTAQNTDYQHKTHTFFKLLIKDFYFPSEKIAQDTPSVSRHFRAAFYFKNRFFPPNYISTDTPPPNASRA